MCRSHEEGGRRCSRANQTRLWRTGVTERLARNRRVAEQVDDPQRAATLREMVERDEALLGQIKQAVSRYGEHVSPHHIEMPDDVHDLVEGMRERGFRCVLVGGSVRDSFDGTAPKDLDFEVYSEDHGKTFGVDDVARAARSFGRVDEVGKSFGVLKMTMPSGTDIDLSVPRRENKTGVGHRAFSVQVDPTLTVEEAAARRDFTVNAMSYDPHLGVLIDPHGGKQDLDDKRLRHVSDAFDEDPLRVMRGMQFASRYGMALDGETAQRCQRLAAEAGSLPKERLRVEWGKWATKSTYPSSGLRTLHEAGWDEVIPGMKGVAENPEVHREVDAMARVLRDDESGRLDRSTMMVAVLARRMSPTDARAFVSQAIEGKRGQSAAMNLASEREPMPEVTSVAQARQQALGSSQSLRERLTLASVVGDPKAARRSMRVAQRAGVLDGPEEPMVKGVDVLTIHEGRKPGPWVKEVLADAEAAQARGDFRTPAAGREWLRQREQQN